MLTPISERHPNRSLSVVLYAQTTHLLELPGIAEIFDLGSSHDVESWIAGDVVKGSARTCWHSPFEFAMYCLWTLDTLTIFVTSGPNKVGASEPLLGAVH